MKTYLLLFKAVSKGETIVSLNIDSGYQYSKYKDHEFIMKVTIEALSTEDALVCARVYLNMNADYIVEIKEVNIVL